MKILSITGAAGLLYPRNLISKLTPAGTSRVIEVEDKNATKNLTINSDVVKIMVDRGIKELAQTIDAGEAWKSLLPGIGMTSIIAVKVNCGSSHQQVSYAFAESMQKMSFVGDTFPANNIIIYDRKNAELTGKYTLNTSGIGVRCFGTDEPGVGYSTETYDMAGSQQNISRIVTEMCDYLINLSVLKSLGNSGVTLCLKNHYGTCNKPVHTNKCDPYIAALNAIEPIASKQKVFICDALFGIGSGIPQFRPNKILFSTDIVALDTYGRKILADNGCTITNYATHIDKAATGYGLGTNNLSEIDIINIKDPSTGIEDNPLSSGVILEQNIPNPFSDKTQISFHNNKYTHIELLIFDIEGNRVANLIDKMLAQGWHTIEWDGSSKSGISQPSGLYICRLIAGNESVSIIMQMIK